VDERRRQLERRAAQGDPEAAAAFLAEQLRAGEADRDRVALRAAFGDPVAQRVLPEVRVIQDADAAGVLEQVEPLGRRALVILLVDLERGLAANVTPYYANSLIARAEAAERWLTCPCRQHALAAHDVAREIARASLGIDHLYAVEALYVAQEVRGAEGASSLRALCRIAAREAVLRWPEGWRTWPVAGLPS
jgi:hypothetical protein